MHKYTLTLTVLVLAWIGLGQFIHAAEYAAIRLLSSHRRTSAARARRGDYR